MTPAREPRGLRRRPVLSGACGVAEISQKGAGMVGRCERKVSDLASGLAVSLVMLSRQVMARRPVRLDRDRESIVRAPRTGSSLTLP